MSGWNRSWILISILLLGFAGFRTVSSEEYQALRSKQVQVRKDLQVLMKRDAYSHSKYNNEINLLSDARFIETLRVFFNVYLENPVSREEGKRIFQRYDKFRKRCIAGIRSELRWNLALWTVLVMGGYLLKTVVFRLKSKLKKTHKKKTGLFHNVVQ